MLSLHCAGALLPVLQPDVKPHLAARPTSCAPAASHIPSWTFLGQPVPSCNPTALNPALRVRPQPPDIILLCPICPSTPAWDSHPAFAHSKQTRAWTLRSRSWKLPSP